jgi:hypothetical protein
MIQSEETSFSIRGRDAELIDPRATKIVAALKAA